MSCPSETRLQAFVDGALAEDEIAELSRHLDVCEECRTLVGMVQPVALDDEGADRVGRYVLRRVIGSGGMGVVYEAVDPELQRVVALKVLRSDLGDQQERLLREAQALAMLSHPNVVTVHDVGRAGERVFIVMALVQGASLRHWLAREERTVAQVLDAFEQAAEGLAAAHAAGLVHRDFKPENAFVAEDGRVVVGDFGLATVGGEDADAAGSLAYMAPEQRRGEKADARSDQYSFCVALGEALPVRPRWLAAIVTRGTSEKPADRFASMNDLLAALRAGRKRSRGRRMVAVAVLGVAGVGAALYARGPSAEIRAQCKARDAEMTAAWSPDVAKRIEQAFRDTKSPLADAAWKRASAVLGEYTGAWRAAHQRVCEGPRSDPKASCLADRLAITRAVTTSLEHPDAQMLEQLPFMLQLLPRVSTCEDAGEIAQLAPPPPPAKAAAVDAAKKKVASASVTVAAGRYKEGLALAEEGFTAAKETAYLPVLADAYLVLGTAHGRLGHAKDAEQALEQAASSASAGHAPAVAIRAWIQLVHFIGYEAKRYDDGARYADYAKAALESMPGAYDLEAERLSWSRAMLLDQKRYDDALAVSRQELALVELRFGPSHRLTAAALDGLAGGLAGSCKPRDAIEPQEKACAILEKEYGSPHPQVALCLGNLAALYAALGEHARALPMKERALAMFEELPGHPNHVAMAHRNRVRSLIELGRVEDARAELVKAAAMSDETTVLVIRGELRLREGKIAEALADHELAVARTAEPPRKLEPLLALAKTDLAAEKWADAEANAGQAATIARSVHGERSCRLAPPLRLQADALLGKGRASEALPLAERSLSLLEGAQPDPLALAQSQLAVARALPPADRPRARRLAEAARPAAAARDPSLAARIDAWLASE